MSNRRDDQYDDQYDEYVDQVMFDAVIGMEKYKNLSYNVLHDFYRDMHRWDYPDPDNPDHWIDVNPLVTTYDEYCEILGADPCDFGGKNTVGVVFCDSDEDDQREYFARYL